MTATSVRPPAQRAAPGQDRRLDRHALAAVLLGVLGVGALATIGLWCWDTPFGGVHGTGGALTAAGRITGLAGGYLLVVEVALMARTPWLEERVGADWLARVHRSLGEYTVILIVSHAVLLILGSALTSHTSVLSAGVTMVFQYEDVLKATLATGLLVGIGVLSARAVRRRLRYETWQATHVLAYLAVLLGFFHQTSIGFDLSSPVAKVGWTGLHLLVGGAALWWRVIAPLRLSLRHGFTVAGVLAEAPGTVSVVITGNRLDELNAEPGQFFRWRFLSRDRWWQAHPFSLSAAPQANGLRITVKALGDHTADLGALRPGTRVLAEGPYGAITPKLFGNRRLLLIGGGVGITPLRALLDAVAPVPPRHRPRAALIQRVNHPDELLFRDELTALARAGRVEVHPLVGPPQAVRLDAATLRSLVPDVAKRDVVVCGPPGMVAAALAGLRAAGVPRRRIHVERFEL